MPSKHTENIIPTSVGSASATAGTGGGYSAVFGGGSVNGNPTGTGVYAAGTTAVWKEYGADAVLIMVGINASLLSAVLKGSG
jgi:hypothetical protein